MNLLGIWGAHATTYILVFAVATTLLFSLPISLVPLTWARVFQWRIPDDTHLAVYFGRCLGAFALLFEALMVRASQGHDTALVFSMLLCVCVAMVVIHVWGAIRREQPWTETLEIGLWAFFFGSTWLFFPIASVS